MANISKFIKFLFVLLALITVTKADDAQAALCASPKKPAQVEIAFLTGDLVLDHSLDQAGLRAINSGIDGFPHGGWHRPLGLTVSQLGHQYSTNFTFRKVTGGYCVALKSAEIRVGYTEMTVYVSSDYPEDSCEYKAILEHEREHVEINRRVLESFEAKIKQAVARTVTGKRAIRVYNEAEARSAYLLALKRSLEPVLDALESQRQRRSAKIDSKDSYRRVLSRCDGW